MEKLNHIQETWLTQQQSKEFLEERRGLFNLNAKQIQRFCDYIHQFEKELHLSH